MTDYKLLKDDWRTDGIKLITIKAGSIITKRDSDYIVKNMPQFIYYDYIVENNPEWFEEVKEEKFAPKYDQDYYAACVIYPDGYICHCWGGNNVDIHRLKNDLIRRTPEEAVARTKELLKKLEEKNV